MTMVMWLGFTNLERGAPLHLALAGTGIASAAIELHRGSWRRQPVER
jgi:hypothetical protein